MRTTFANTIQRHAEKDPNIILLSADLGFKVFDEFRERLPRQFIDMGVAEQNMISVAAGLAMTGKKVYCYSMVPFLVMRAFEQIRVDVCNHDLPVTLVGVGGGLSYGMEGMTHHGFEDISVMRSLPGMTVTAPADPIECRGIIDESVSYKGPLFVRLGKNNDPVIHSSETKIKIGKAIIVNEEGDVCILAVGSMFLLGTRLLKELEKQDIRATLVSVHTVKPFDGELVMQLAKRSKAVFTIEEHSIIGGLGSATAECLAEMGYNGRFKRFGLPDRYCSHIGDHEYLKASCGLTVDCIYREIISTIK